MGASSEKVSGTPSRSWFSFRKKSFSACTCRQGPWLAEGEGPRTGTQSSPKRRSLISCFRFVISRSCGSICRGEISLSLTNREVTWILVALARTRRARTCTTGLFLIFRARDAKWRVETVSSMLVLQGSQREGLVTACLRGLLLHDKGQETHLLGEMQAIMRV